MDTVIIEGQIHKVGETETFNSGFQKRELVIDTGGDYPKKIPVQFTKDKCSFLDKLAPGFVVKVECFVNGNEWKGRFFVSLQAYKIEIIEGSPIKTEESTRNPQGIHKESTQFTTKYVGDDSSEDDDVPF